MSGRNLPNSAKDFRAKLIREASDTDWVDELNRCSNLLKDLSDDSEEITFICSLIMVRLVTIMEVFTRDRIKRFLQYKPKKFESFISKALDGESKSIPLKKDYAANILERAFDIHDIVAHKAPLNSWKDYKKTFTAMFDHYLDDVIKVKDPLSDLDEPIITNWEFSNKQLSALLRLRHILAHELLDIRPTLTHTKATFNSVYEWIKATDFYTQELLLGAVNPADMEEQDLLLSEIEKIRIKTNKIFEEYQKAFPETDLDIYYIQARWHDFAQAQSFMIAQNHKNNSASIVQLKVMLKLAKERKKNLKKIIKKWKREPKKQS